MTWGENTMISFKPFALHSDFLRKVSDLYFFFCIIFRSILKSDTNIGKFIIRRIIPLVSFLRGYIPIRVSVLFSSAILQECGLPTEIDCRDLDQFDAFFDQIKERYVHLTLLNAHI